MANPASLQQTSDFCEVLTQRIDAYFNDNDLSIKGDWRMALKIVAAMAGWAATILPVYLFELTHLQFFLMYMMHGAAQLYLMLNISHDANHKAISGRPLVNKVLSYTFDLCGINSFVWRTIHLRAHHYCINIYGEDENIDGQGLMRLTPDAPRKAFHKYQHFYAYFLYCLYILDLILYKDFQFFFLPKKYLNEVKIPAREYVILFIGKIFYLGYMIALPITVLDLPVWLVLVAFFFAQFLLSFVAIIVLQITHINEVGGFPKAKNQFEHFIYHVLASTADYSRSNPLANWFFGGLHIHAIHHIRPHVCHMHFPELTKILRTTASEYGVQYRESKTTVQAWRKHRRFLKQLGQTDLSVPG